MNALTIAAQPRLGAISGLPIAGAGTVGPLAARLSLTAAHASAARRHAERLESAGSVTSALEAWRLAAFVEPGHTGSWSAIARCLRLLGDDAMARNVAAVAARLTNEETLHATDR